jgi:hypothetical protein
MKAPYIQMNIVIFFPEYPLDFGRKASGEDKNSMIVMRSPLNLQVIQICLSLIALSFFPSSGGII